jgi:probable HAF family extracellular repeat protein
MKSKLTLLLILATLPFSVGVGLSQQAATKAPSYDLINLGTPLGGSFAIVAGISYGGFLGGYANVPDNTAQHAILWYPNNTKDLGTLGGPNSALLENFAGFSETATPDPLNQDTCETGTHLICLPITVVHGKAVALPLLGGNSGAAFGNNEWGQVAGAAQTSFHDPSCLVSGAPVAPAYQILQEVPAIWTNGKVRQLPLPSGDSEGSANAINDFGQATGSTGDCVSNGAAHAVYWRNGKPIILPTLGGLMNNNAFGINDFGQITGTSDLSGDLTGHATLWQNGTVQDLGTLPGDYSSYGNAINNFGQIVGSSCDVNFNCRGFLWEKGKMYDLNTLIPSNPNLSLTLGAVIDDAGVIGGYGYDQTAGTNPAFVALPSSLFKGHHESEAASATAAVSEAAPRLSTPQSSRTPVPHNLRDRRLQRPGQN